MPTPVHQELLDVMDAVFAVNGGLLRVGDLLGRDAGVTSAQWQVLGLLEHGPDTAASVARRRGLRRQSVQETADRLLALGMVERLDNSADRRAPLLAMTPTGREALARISTARDAWLNQLGDGLDVDDLRAAVRALRVLRERLGLPPRDSPYAEDHGER